MEMAGSLPGERRRRGPNATNPNRAVMVLLFTTAALVVLLLGTLAATAFSSAGVGKGLVGSNGGAAEGGPSPLEQVRGLVRSSSALLTRDSRAKLCLAWPSCRWT